jgi:hypothetical protein
MSETSHKREAAWLDSTVCEEAMANMHYVVSRPI